VEVSGGEAVVGCLVEHGVKTVYGLPGSHVLDVYDALRDESRIRHITVIHEVNAAFMADAHGRLTGSPGVCLVTAGPGATNAVTAIAQAYAEASPVVEVTGHCDTAQRAQPFHGVDDWDFLMKIHRPITKWCARVERVEEIPAVLGEAFARATSGRPGPVHVEIPRDILASSGTVEGFGAPRPKEDVRGVTAAVEGVAEVLNSASRPLMALGRGVLREFCWDGAMRLAEALGAPVLALRSALGAVPYQFPLYVGYDVNRQMNPLIRPLVEEADVILTLGLDLGERLGTFPDKAGVLVHVHQGPPTATGREAGTRGPEPLMDVETGIGDFVASLLGRVRPRGVAVRAVEDRVSGVKEEIRRQVMESIRWGSRPVHPGEVCVELGRVLDEDAVVAVDLGNCYPWMRVCYGVRRPNTFLDGGRYGSMGFSLPAAMAAKVNFPGRQAVAVTGDGAFLMSSMDFPTAVKEGLGVVVVVMYNRQYGMIWQLQTGRFGGRTFATEIGTPDFAEYARSFGAVGVRVREPGELRGALEEAVNAGGPAIVDVETDYQCPFYRPRFR